MKNNNILLSLRNIAAAAVRRHATLLVAVLCLGVTFSSCRKDPIPGNGDNGDKTEQELVNEWTYDVLKFYYLWNEEVQNTVPTTYDVDYQTFLNNYLSGLTTNKLDGKTSSGGSRSLYSYISRYEVSRASSTFEPTYGFDFTAYAFNIRNKDNQTELRYFARIHYVTPDSPAANAGLKRGDWIGQIDGKKLTAANFNDINKLFAQNTVSVKILKCEFTANETGTGITFSEDDADQTITLTRAAVEQNPIFCYRTFDADDGSKIGYLCFNAFKRGIDETDTDNHTEYEEQLREVFRGFRNEGVSHLVLDLRYNPGGYVVTCQLLSSMIAPESVLGTRFLECRPNSSRRSSYYDLLKLSDVSDCNLNLNKLYVIATENSASASELVINNLRGVGVDVVHVGTTTVGKVVGMEIVDHKVNSNDEAVFGSYHYMMHPVSFRSYNARGESDYENGLVPDILYDEYMNEQNLDWLNWGELGEPDEPMLALALNIINGRSTAATANANANASKIHAPIGTGFVDCRSSITLPERFGGSIVRPNDNLTE